MGSRRGLLGLIMNMVVMKKHSLSKDIGMDLQEVLVLAQIGNLSNLQFLFEIDHNYSQKR